MINCIDALSRKVPIAVDMDGTLLLVDSLHENLLHVLRQTPWRIVYVGGWLMTGRAALKHRLAQTTPRSDLWPLRVDLVEWLQRKAAEGHEIVLATAADQRIAEAVAVRLPFVSRVIGSSDGRNLKGEEKAHELVRLFPHGFAYIGNHPSDKAIWAVATGGAGLAGPVARLRRHLPARDDEPVEFPSQTGTTRDWRKALRLHQWSKNMLVFVPLFLSGQAGSFPGWLLTIQAFLAVGLVASGGYIVNDLWDLDNDRQHRSKRHRPLPSGNITIPAAIIAAAGCIMLGLSIALHIGVTAFWVVVLYLATTLSYSFKLKQVPILDVTILATLFTIRLLLGSVAVDVSLSIWLMMFSMFLFGSLSLAKRCAELTGMNDTQPTKVAGRGYRRADLPLLLSLGVATAISAILIFILYLVEAAFPAPVYNRPQLLWIVPVLLFLFTNRIWLLCHRGELNEDPVLFAIKDPVSLTIGGLVVLAFLAAMI